jgi:CDP-diacylglycerol--glycerol-3-phosphate 3-phosphatidyltransferase
MAVVIASAHLNDDEFLTALGTCELPLSSFRHGDHLRLAWLQLHRKPFGEALRLVQEGIRRYAAHHEVSHIYHETVTIAWVRLLATHREATFKQFITENEDRLNLDLLHRFWSPTALNSETARLNWLPPDKESLPK